MRLRVVSSREECPVRAKGRERAVFGAGELRMSGARLIRLGRRDGERRKSERERIVLTEYRQTGGMLARQRSS
jgi:hypothetical protein